jgi:enterobactin synthetase component D
MFLPVDSVAVLPDFVAQHSVVFDVMGELALDGIEIPASLDSAVPKRRIEFAAGRYCVREALRTLAPLVARNPIAIAQDGSPVWPLGFVGSITHTDAFASAVVASSEDAIGLGIDSESLIEPRTAVEVGQSIATIDELARLSLGTCASEQFVLTAVFSAKESIYKCLRRVVGRYFDFLDAEITDFDIRAGRFAGRLVRTLTARLPAGTVLSGRFAFDGDRIHTGIALLALEESGPPRFA